MSANPTGPRPNCVMRVPAKDTYSTSGPKLMGRQSANEGLLTGWFRHSGHAEFWCLARHREEAQVFARIGEGVHAGWQTPPVYRWIAQQQLQRAKAIGTVFLPGPQVADLAWVRRRHAGARASDFSLIGMTHTTCEMPIQDGLADMLTAPVYEWDAQICPSRSVQAMVRRLLDDEAAWLREHLGASQVRLPQLPVIPLGVDCDALDLPPDERAQQRSVWRERWQLGADDVCVLYMGRLDLRTKANLLPTLDALQLAAQALGASGGPRLHLVLAGWFASEWDERTLREAVTRACPAVRVLFEDGRTSEARRGVWHAADIFSSLVDNVQETFGLTPIEAMAAGLPVVVSDYDGYRESVRDGIDGYRIRTWQPGAGAGVELMDLHADLMIGYADYVSRASAWIGIDIADAAAAFARLAADASLRRSMGEAGRLRARTGYDWAVLVPALMALFEDLAVVRGETGGRAAPPWRVAGHADWGARHPRRSDPYHSFSHYPSDTLGAPLLLFAGPCLPADEAGQRAALAQQLERPVYAGVRAGLDASLLLALLQRVAWSPHGLAWQDWIVGSTEAASLLGQLGWLAKCGLIRIERPGGPR